MEHVIETSNHPLIEQPPRRIPFAHHDQISRMVKEMLEAEVYRNPPGYGPALW